MTGCMGWPIKSDRLTSAGVFSSGLSLQGPKTKKKQIEKGQKILPRLLETKTDQDERAENIPLSSPMQTDEQQIISE